jgi:hypothetical protein
LVALAPDVILASGHCKYDGITASQPHVADCVRGSR